MNFTQKPLIGFACSYDEAKKRIFINENYFEAVLKSGGLPVALPYAADAVCAAEIVTALDGIVFAGGVDIDPAFYGAEKSEKCGEICASRDLSESFYVRAALTAAEGLELPIFGICRGIQALNVFTGGSLLQDISSEMALSVPHGGSRHEISVLPGSVLHGIVKSEKITVNSHHHQAVKHTSDIAFPTAFAPDGVIEAMELKGRSNALAVQFHPEMTFGADDYSRELFVWFVSKCGKYKNKKNFKSYETFFRDQAY